MSKRVKISFEAVNAGKVVEIDRNDLVASSQRIKVAMTEVVRRYKRNDALSKVDARALVLNA